MPSCWIVTEDGLIGTENQCIGIAEHLGIDYTVKRIGLKQPWKSLSPYIGFENARSFSGDSLAPPWPDLLLSSGRKAIAASRYIKKASHGKSFTVQIQDPRIDPSHFDMVIVPEHDPTRGVNVITTKATPNKITPEILAHAKEQFKDLLSPLKTPRVAVLIGGTSKAYEMNEAIMRQLSAQLATLDKEGYGLMVTASRRTGEQNLQILMDTMKDSDAFIWDGKTENPYMGFLAWADFIIVTADSASMISEAITAGKPVYIQKLDGGMPRIDRFHGNLIDGGYARWFEGSLEAYHAPPLTEAKDAAQAILKRFKEFRGEKL